MTYRHDKRTQGACTSTGRDCAPTKCIKCECALTKCKKLRKRQAQKESEPAYTKYRMCVYTANECCARQMHTACGMQ